MTKQLSGQAHLWEAAWQCQPGAIDNFSMGSQRAADGGF